MYRSSTVQSINKCYQVGKMMGVGRCNNYSFLVV